jgi:hypothetical protein
MVFNHTHSQILLRYKENGGRIEPYGIYYSYHDIRSHLGRMIYTQKSDFGTTMGKIGPCIW